MRRHMDFCRLTFAFTAVIEGIASIEDIKAVQLCIQGEGSPWSLSQIAVLLIPHSSRQLQLDEHQAIRLDGAALNSELLRMTDAHTDELFPLTPAEAGRVIFPVSRLVCDVERFPSDGDEPMAARGMGAIYTHTTMGGVLRAQLDAAYREALLDRYWPHHVRLERMVNDIIAWSGM
jgi:N-formylglutamate deformylase